MDRPAGRVGSGRVQELVNFSGSGHAFSGSGREIWTRVQLCGDSSHETYINCL